MPKYLITLLFACLLAFPAWAQEQEAAGETADTAATEAAEAGAAEQDADADEAGDVAADEAIDDSDLDEQTYEEDDDDFVPTEEIPADEPIPFPSNI
jgi:hypothetical protein